MKNHLNLQIVFKKNQIIALPTETVFGLAGNAYSDLAVKKIYKIKKKAKKIL